MPPKTPGMKFKPKLVKTQRQETDDNADGHDAALAARQLERSNRAQQEVVSSSPPPQPAGHLASNSTILSSSGAQGGLAGGRALRTTTMASSSARPVTESQTFLDMFSGAQQVPETAPALPLNTLHTALTAANADDGAMGFGGQVEDRYPPIPLATKATTQIHGTGRAGAGGSDSMQKDGTAFLRGMEDELATANRHNQRFYKDVLEPFSPGFRDPNVPSSQAYGNSFGEGSDGVDQPPSSLVWIQLPRWHTASSSGSGPCAVPFDLQQLPPGKIGEFKVYESGRMTMEINGCCFDVLAEAPHEEDGAGACCIAAMTQIGEESASTSSYPNPLLEAFPGQQYTANTGSCYFLDVLQHKLTATPTISEE